MPAAGVNIFPSSVPLIYTVAPAVPEKPDTVFAREKAVFHENTSAFFVLLLPVKSTAPASRTDMQ
jgi:hypothetical protein